MNELDWDFIKSISKGKTLDNYADNDTNIYNLGYAIKILAEAILEMKEKNGKS